VASVVADQAHSRDVVTVIVPLPPASPKSSVVDDAAS